MNKFTIFESSIIGLFVGVIISTYVAFLDSTGRFIGSVLNWVSLIPLFDKIPFLLGRSLFITFLCIVFVYLVYGVFFGIIIKFTHKTTYIAFFITLLFLGMSFEQYFGSKTHKIVTQDYTPIVVQTITKEKEKTPEQYFGNEVVGDLNGDDKDDVAFIIPRPDEVDGMLYYLTAALHDEKGHSGTNLVFLGYKIDPKTIEIENQQIIIHYIERGDKTATTTKTFYAQIVGNLLKKVKPSVSTTTATSTIQ